jgi:regulator of protease activity HflC (stomatin/prohibitin superfamily)
MVALLFILTIIGLIYGIGGNIANKYSKARSEEFERARAAGNVRNQRGPTVYDFKLTKGISILSTMAFVLFIVFWTFIIKIDGQSVGVITTPSGVKTEAYHTGWHFLLPWWEVHNMDKTVWVYTCAKSKKEGEKKLDDDAIWAPTSEGIKMGFDISASWRIDSKQASWIFQNVTPEDGDENSRYIWLEENVIRTKLKSSLALTVSEYTPIETYSMRRQEIQDKVYKKMKEDLKGWKIILDQIDIREVYYDSQYEKEIKNKKVQEQKALTLIEVTKQVSELLKQETIKKDIVIQTAQGEAEALKIKGQSINANPKIIELEWINKWDGALPTYMMGERTNMMMMLKPE